MREDSTSRPTEPFVHRRQIVWGDTDTARIVYTARVPHFAMEAIEAWLIDRLGVGFYDMNTRLGFGTPMVHLEVDFVSPMTPRDRIGTRVLVERVGRSSMTFALASYADEGARLCWTGRFVCACVSTEDFSTIKVPEQFRDALAHELELAKSVP